MKRNNLNSSPSERPLAPLEIENIQQALLNAGQCLSLWQCDLGTALYHLLTAFEELVRSPFNGTHASSSQERQNQASINLHAYASCLPHLFRWAYLRCPPSRWNLSPPVFDENAYRDAVSTLNFGADYSIVVDAMEDVRDGKQLVSIEGKRITFSYSNKGAMDYKAAAQFAKNVLAVERPDPFTIFEILKDEHAAALVRLVKSGITATDNSHIQYAHVPAQVEEFCSALATKATDTTQQPVSTRVAGYSIAEFRQFFRALYRRAAINQSFCWLSGYAGSEKSARANLTFTVTGREMFDELVGGGQIGEKQFYRIIEDCTFNASYEESDPFMQPLD